MIAFRQQVDAGGGWRRPVPAAAPARVPAPVPTTAPFSLYDSAKLAQLVSASAPGADGRKVLGSGILDALNSLSGGSIMGAGNVAESSVMNGADSFQRVDAYWTPGTYSANGQTLDLNIFGGSPSNPGFASEADYRARLKASGLDPTKNYGTLGFHNPTGSSSDWLRPIYEIGADGTAKPVAVSNSYVNDGLWVGGLRDFVKLASLAVAAVVGVGAVAAAGTAGGTAAAASAATVDAGAGSTLTIAGAGASGFGSGLGIDGFGAGLGSTISASGAGADLFGSLGAWGTAAGTAADLTFAGQGISLGSSLATTAKTVASTASEVAKAAPTTTAPTTAALTTTAPAAVDAGAGAGSWGAGSVLKTIGTGAGLVGTAASAVGAVQAIGKGNAFPSSSGASTGPQMAAQQRSDSWLLLLAAAAGVYLLS